MNVDLSQAQLFLDNLLVADSHQVTRVWHQPVKYPEPVLRAEYPWEYNCPALFGTVLRREGLFRMWYVAWTREMRPQLLYAESDDGVHWRKPALGQYEVCGSRENNVVLHAADPEAIIDDCAVIEDDADAEWPLKMLYWDSSAVIPEAERHGGPGYGIWAARSRDGLHWESLGMVLPQWYDRFNAAPARQHGKFVVLGRAPGSTRPGGRGRRVWRTESEDLRHWTEPQLVLQPDEEDPAAMQYYSAVQFDYESLTLGGIERMYMDPDKLDTELVFSRDGGWTWQHARTRPRFIEWGAPGAWDSIWLNLSASAPIRRHNRLWFYYSGRSDAHHAPYPHNYGGIGLATLRMDGFCSLMAGAEEGFVQTPVLRWPGGDLLVNSDARRDERAHRNYTAQFTGAGGGIRVEVRDTAGRPIDGFTAADCEPLGGNTELEPSGYGTACWNRGKSLHELTGRDIRLCFRLRDAQLYAFRAGGETNA
ncbi:MAG: hypothetical protein ACYDCO_25360 [Armatimonadota bacterium]